MIQILSSSTLVLQLTTIFLTIGMLISSFEYLFNHKLFTSEGILEWIIIKIRWKNGPIKNFLNFMFKRGLINILLAIRVVFLIVLLIAPLLSPIFWASVLIIFGTYAVTNLVAFYGSDGSDQMNSLILITICLCASPFTSEGLLVIGCMFIAAQSCLSYFVAGASKLFSKEWRNGSAVREIFKTRTYGSEKVYRYIKNKRGLNFFLCWSVIIAELSFPLVLFLPIEWGIYFLAWGLVFHLINSIVMGLNTFLWAFLASYPSIVFLNLYLAN